MPEGKKKFHLSAVELDEVSLVDHGANQFAKVVLMKRADMGECSKDCPVLKAVKPGEKMDMTGCLLKKTECHRMEVEKAPKGIQLNIGFKEGGGSEIQSVVFDSEQWDEEKAKVWLKDHEMEAGKMDKTANTLRFRQKDPEDYTRFRMITPGKQVSKALRASDSWSRVQAAVDTAVRAKYQPKTEPNMPMLSYLYVRDFFEDSVIMEMDGKAWRCDYEIDRNENGELQVTVGEQVPVEIVYQDVKKDDAPLPEPEVPAELLIKLGHLQAKVAGLNYKLEKGNSCHIPSGSHGGEFCSGGGKGGGGGVGGGGKVPNTPDSTGKIPVPKAIAQAGASLAEDIMRRDRNMDGATDRARWAGRTKTGGLRMGAKAETERKEAQRESKKAVDAYHEGSKLSDQFKQKHGIDIVQAWEAANGRRWPYYRVDSTPGAIPTHYVKD